MQKIVLFIGKKFQINTIFHDYIVRNIRSSIGDIDTIYNYQESDNALFLHLETLLKQKAEIIIITSKSAFSLIGKLLCTSTADNQILKDNMLIPSSTSVFEHNTYLLQYKHTLINVLCANENEELPNILLKQDTKESTIQLFNIDQDSAAAVLLPIAQTYEVKLHYSTLVSEWIILKIESKKFGNISQFIASAKSLLGNKLIASSDIPAYLIEKLSHANKKVSFAESCTGGRLASFITGKGGSSAIFDGSLVTYANAIKENSLWWK